MSEITDYHTLDTCDCGGTLDAWTSRFTPEERAESGYPQAHYRTEWVCRRCGDVSDRYHDEAMNDLR